MKEDEFEGLQKTLREFLTERIKVAKGGTITGVAMSSQCSEKPPSVWILRALPTKRRSGLQSSIPLCKWFARNEI